LKIPTKKKKENGTLVMFIDVPKLPSPFKYLLVAILYFLQRKKKK